MVKNVFGAGRSMITIGPATRDYFWICAIPRVAEVGTDRRARFVKNSAHRYGPGDATTLERDSKGKEIPLPGYRSDRSPHVIPFSLNGAFLLRF